MPFFFNIFLVLFLASGFYFLGKIVTKFFRFLNVIQKISNPSFQYTLIGISFFLFFIYPLFFLIKFNKFLFGSISYIFICLGIYNFYIYLNSLKKIVSKIIYRFKNKDFYFIFLLIFLIFYFLYSLSPVTSADSVAYHTTVAKYLIEHGSFPTNPYDFGSLLSGSGELLNAFAISIGAFQFSSFVHFLGLISTLGIIIKFSKDNRVKLNNRFLLILTVISCPVLIFLIGSSKPQFFYISCIVLSYAILINLKNIKVNQEITKSFFLSFILCIVSVQAKISFSISFFLIIVGYLYITKKSFLNIKVIFLIFLILCFSFLPSLFWKEIKYDYPFYNFFYNPLPLNIPGVLDFYLHVKEYEPSSFPLSLFFPSSISTITTNIGVGLFTIFFVINKKFKQKNFFIFCILFFFITFSLLGQKSPRFYLEIYLLLIILFIFVINRFQNNLLFKFFVKLIYLQSLYVFILLIYGTFSLFPGSITKEWNHKVLSKYSYGYNLYYWTDSILPPKSIILTNHRGYFYSNLNIIYADFIFTVHYSNFTARNYLLEEIKSKKPQYILFYDFKNNFNYLSYNFKDCVNDLHAKAEKVGFHESRNPFNSVKEKYNAYIFLFDYKKLPGCVKEN